MARYRTYSEEFKKKVADEYRSGGTLHGLAKRYDLSRNLIRLWARKHSEAGSGKLATGADHIQIYQARIAALEQLVGKQALEIHTLQNPDRAGQLSRAHAPSKKVPPQLVGKASGH